MAENELIKIPRVKIIKDEEFLKYAQAILAQARRSVFICTYKFEFSKRPVARGLNTTVLALYGIAMKRIPVKVLLNITGRRSGLTRINEFAGRILQKNGLQVRYLPGNRCQHAKALLVDDSFAIIGSHNWSPRSVTENSELSVVLHDQFEVAEITRHFELLWETSKELRE